MKKLLIIGVLSGCLAITGCLRKTPKAAVPALPPTTTSPATAAVATPGPAPTQGAPPVSGAPTQTVNAPAPMVPAAPVAEPLPTPRISFVGSQEWTARNGDVFIRYRFRVLNWKDFPNDLFLPSPDLPPCGLNPNSARAWVDLFADGRRVYGFCALESSQALEDALNFSIVKGQKLPIRFFIRLNDRKLNRFSQSEVIELPE